MNTIAIWEILNHRLVHYCLRNFRGVDHFQANSPLTNFQISLLAGLHTLSNLFHYKTHKQPILRHLSLFAMHLKFQINLAKVSLMKEMLNKFKTIIL